MAAINCNVTNSRKQDAVPRLLQGTGNYITNMLYALVSLFPAETSSFFFYLSYPL